MVNSIAITAGHSSKVVGASSDYGVENTLATVFITKLRLKLQELGFEKVKTFSSNADSVTKYLQAQVEFSDNTGYELALQVHFNAGGGTGTECLYYPGNATTQAMAGALSKAVAGAMGITNRGAKARDDLYFLKNTKVNALLLEICFLDNASDMISYNAGLDKIIMALVKALTGLEPASVKPNNGISAKQKSEIMSLINELLQKLDEIETI